MGNILTEYGSEEFSERVIGAVVEYEGKPHLLTRLLSKQVVQAIKIEGTPEKLKQEDVMLSTDIFTGMAMLKHPPLGYRSAAAGQYLAFFSKVPTPMRKGLHMDRYLNVKVNELSKYLQSYTDISFQHYNVPEVKASLIWTDCFLPLHEGIKRMRGGELLSFVVDNNFAVVPDWKQTDNLVILYRDRAVGHIKPNGDIKFASKWVVGAWDSINAAKEI